MDPGDETARGAVAVHDFAEVLIGDAQDGGGGAVTPPFEFERDFLRRWAHLFFRCSTLNIHICRLRL